MSKHFREAVTTRPEDNGRMPRPMSAPLRRRDISSEWDVPSTVQVFEIDAPNGIIFHVVQGAKSWPCTNEDAVEDCLSALGV